MEQLRKGRAFLESGPWVPLEVDVPLRRSLESLQARLKIQERLNPPIALLLHLKMTRLAYMVEAGTRHHQLVSVDTWKRAVREIRLLTTWLAARYSRSSTASQA
jgi:hypothetical protein